MRRASSECHSPAASGTHSQAGEQYGTRDDAGSNHTWIARLEQALDAVKGRLLNDGRRIAVDHLVFRIPLTCPVIREVEAQSAGIDRIGQQAMDLAYSPACAATSAIATLIEPADHSFDAHWARGVLAVEK